EVEDAGVALNKIINRKGDEVEEAADLEFQGLNRLCSAQYIEANQFGDNRGLADDLFFTGEETNGGTEFVLNPDSGTLLAAPWMGRAAWENVTELDTGTTDKVAFLVGDDREAAPLLMYVGEKNTTKDAELLERNGLAEGKLYAWVPQADLGDTPTFTNDEGDQVDSDQAPDPAGFNGTGNSEKGDWVELDYYRPDLAGSASDTNDDGSTQDELGYDDQGFATQAQQDKLFIDAGGFQFSRIEDVATNPNDGTEAVFAASGRGDRFEADNWGTTYRIDTEFNSSGDPLTGQIDILYSGDDAGDGRFRSPDFGLRSPDNLDWADNGKILIQENRATASDGDFGGASQEEASVWELDPETDKLTRVAQIDRSALPAGQTDSEAGDLGNWESSGILDVSELFDQDPGTRFIFDVQAHSVEDGIIAEKNLVQGGQLEFLTTEGDL
ncbi:MAG: alkaline phosphatase PhoX, partial [Waterburya sp.]